MKEKIYQIIEPSTGLKALVNNNAIDTECLFGEGFKLIDIKGKWSFGISMEDQYKGWIKSNALGVYLNSTHNIASTRSFVMTKPDVKSKVINYLPFRSKVKILKIKDNWAQLELSENKNYDHGYILITDILAKNEVQLNWIKYAKMLLSVPYRWGGRDSIGIDCSALLQLSKAFTGEKLPRDSGKQFEYFKNLKNYLIFVDFRNQDFTCGDIIYWKGHIAVVISKTKLIHASASHGKEKNEKILQVIQRIDKKYFLIREKS